MEANGLSLTVHNNNTEHLAYNSVSTTKYIIWMEKGI